VDTDAGRVEFNPVHKSDEGIYTCVAINDVGAANTSANVRVLGTTPAAILTVEPSHLQELDLLNCICTWVSHTGCVRCVYDDVHPSLS